MQNQARRMDKDHSQVSSPTSIRDQETEKDAATSSLRSSIGPLSMYDAETCKLSTEDAERDLSPFKTVETEADHPRSRGENPISNDMMFDSQEAWLFMHYLDEVFPWQFPYHSSYSQIGNRGWLLLLMAKRGPLYHAAISLSSLHQTAISEDECEQKEEALIKHSRALRELCGFMSLQKPLENKACLTEFLASCLILISCEVSHISGLILNSVPILILCSGVSWCRARLATSFGCCVLSHLQLVARSGFRVELLSIQQKY
jgi:hypothetical protein